MIVQGLKKAQAYIYVWIQYKQYIQNILLITLQHFVRCENVQISALLTKICGQYADDYSAA